jgi:hypothetical protein
MDQIVKIGNSLTKLKSQENLGTKFDFSLKYINITIHDWAQTFP